MVTAAEALGHVINELGFVFFEQNGAIGHVGEYPVALTVLDVAPAAFMLTFRVSAEGRNESAVTSGWTAAYTGRSNVSFEPGVAWLELYGLGEPTADQLRPIFESFPDALTVAGYSVGGACLRCGTEEDLQLTCADARPTRLCKTCHDELFREKREIEESLNRPGLSEAFRLPLAVLLSAVIWAVWWTGVDWVFETLEIEEIELNRLTMLLMFLPVIGVGYALGRPPGRVLRRTGSGKWVPWILTTVTVVMTVIVGEFFYVTIVIWNRFGIFDLSAAVRGAAHLVRNYGSGLWPMLRFTCAAAMWLFCQQAACEKKVVPLEVLPEEIAVE